MDSYTEYLVFKQDFLPGLKTGVWVVNSCNHGFRLGVIKWNGQWRQYTFFPEYDTVWSAGCLRDLANFIESVKKYRVPDFPKPNLGKIIGEMVGGDVDYKNRAQPEDYTE